MARLEDANRRLEARDRLHTSSLSMVSHELLSPLTSAKGYIENLLGGVAGHLPAKAMQYLLRIGSNTDRLIRLTTMLLDSTRLDEGPMPVRPESVPLADVVSDLLREFEAAAAEKAPCPASGRTRAGACEGRSPAARADPPESHPKCH